MDAQSSHLQPADEQRLWKAFNEQHSQDARNLLIDHYLPLSGKIAKMLYAKRGGLEVEFVDYLQQAAQGLIEAIDRFDPTRGVAFEAYAALRIRGAVLNSLTAMSEKYAQLSLRKRLRQERVESLTEEMPRAHARAGQFPRTGGSRRWPGDQLHARGHRSGQRRAFTYGWWPRRLLEPRAAAVGR